MRAEKLRKYEGLVFSTARMYAGRLRVEEDDLQQVLRLRIWKALEAYDPRRSRVIEESFVFTCVRNQIKDLVKARIRRDNAKPGWMPDEVPGIREVYIEDQQPGWEIPVEEQEGDEVLLPSTLTANERQVVALLYVGFSQAEIAVLMTVPPREVWAHVRVIREKMADWRPTSPDAQVVHLATEALTVLQAA
jgi:RNA polymerase sigma factor (sigma-70 family)